MILRGNIKTLTEIRDTISLTPDETNTMESKMDKIRIEMHLTEKETELLDNIAEKNGRSRKNLCETELRKIIQSFLMEESR